MRQFEFLVGIVIVLDEPHILRLGTRSPGQSLEAAEGAPVVIEGYSYFMMPPMAT